jgi:hypothetical protein
MKKLIVTLSLCAFFATAAFAQDRPATDTGALPLNLSTYAGYFGFVDSNIRPSNPNVTAAPKSERDMFGVLDDRSTISTPLEFALLSYYSQPVVNIRPVDAQTMLPARNKTSETQLAAWSAIELAVLRFTNPGSPSIGKYEGILHFIKGRQTDATSDDITQNEINAAVRQIVSAEVDAQFKGITVPAGTLAYIKQSLTDFYLTPSQTTFTAIRNIHHSTDGNISYIQQAYDADMQNASNSERLGYSAMASEFKQTAMAAQRQLNNIRRQIKAPDNASIDWDDFRSGYIKVVTTLSSILADKVRQ